MIRQNAFEVKEFKVSLETKKTQLENSLSSVKEKIEFLDDMIKQNDKNEQHWMIVLPANFIELNETPLPVKYNWKKIAMKLLVKYDMPMTSELMYNKAINQIEGLYDKRRYVLKNLSAALHYLSEKDNTLIRKKISGKKEYLYILKTHVDEKGNIIPAYIDKFKNENFYK